MPKNPRKIANSTDRRADQKPANPAMGERIFLRTPYFAKKQAWAWGVAVCFLIYALWFFRQPASLPLTDPEGMTANRLAELFVMPMTLADMRGDGVQELGWTDRIPIVLAAILWLALAFWSGRKWVSPLLRRQGWLVTVPVAALVGLALLSSLTLVVGLAGGLQSRWPLLLSVLSLAAISWLWPNAKAIESPEQESSDATWELEPSNLGGLWMMRLIPLMTCVLAALYVLGGAMPPWEYDVLEYHLQAPKEYYRQGSIRFIANNVYANMPLGTEMHSLAWMTLIGGERGWWWGGIVGKTISAAVSLLTAAMLGGLVGRRLGRNCGWAIAGLFLATAGNIHVSSTGLVDMVLAGYLFASLVSLALVLPKIGSVQVSFRDYLVIGLLAGAAGACKYPGLVLAVVPCFCVLGFCVLANACSAGKSWSDLWVMTVTFVLAFGVTCLPWLIKNWAQTGNPVYPLATSFFPTPGMSVEQVENWARVHSPPSVDGVPAFSITAAAKSVQQLMVRSPFLNPSLVFLSLLGILALVARRETRCGTLWTVALASTVWVLAVWWFFTHRIDRFWLPVLPAMSLLAALGATYAARQASRTVVIAIVFVGVGYGLLQALSGAAVNDNRFLVSLRALSDEWDGRGEAPPGNRSVAWVNANLTAQDRVLLIGEMKAFGYQVPIVFATCFNEQPAEQWLAGKSTQEQSQSLQAQGITHVLVDWGELERYRSPGNYGFSDWPSREQIKAMVDSGLLRPLETSMDPELVEVFQVRQGSIDDPNAAPQG
ncbi:MAG: hypothetical protein NXI32_00505 [bacterium]|nr:hypothetical protein [bacterium]